MFTLNLDVVGSNVLLALKIMDFEKLFIFTCQTRWMHYKYDGR
jgi:hypothetical protein